MADVQVALGDDYVLERQLGQGGMGTVYLARDTRLHRPVALKVLSADLSGNADLRERFVRETRVAASFSHPNIVPVHAIEDRNGLLAFVMGYVDGETLTARVRRGPLPVPDAVRIVQEVAWALSYAHGRGIVHRDIKPDNILLERATGRALVTDFGIARAVATAPGAGLTRVGEVVGTPQFMSPEQAAGDTVDGRSDIYSLGIVAFFALTGALPFDADNPTALLAMQLTQPPPPLLARRADAPDDLARAIDRCLLKTPDARWASAESLAAALDVLRRAAPDVPPPVRIFLHRFNSALVVAGLMVILALSMLPPRGRAMNLDRMVLLAFVLAAAVGTALSGLRRLRGLQQQGYRYRDILAGVGAVVAEERAAREAIRASEAEMRRRRINRRIALLSMAWPLVLFYSVRTSMRRPVPGHPGMYAVSTPGIISAFGAAVAFGLGFALLMSDPLKPNPWIHLQAAFWRGPLGRALFRLYAGRSAGGTERSAGSAGHVHGPSVGARTLLNALPRELRGQLRDVAVRLAALDVELDALGRREQALRAALLDVTGVAGEETGPGASAREATAAEIRSHLELISTRRDAIGAIIEQARLELVRVRAGLGTPDAVLRVFDRS